MLTFADDLARTRASVIRDPADAVVAVIAEREGITEDPRDNPGYQNEWTRHSWLVSEAIRVMWLGFGLSKGESAERMGYSKTRGSYVASYPTLDDHELETYDAAEALIGRPR